MEAETGKNIAQVCAGQACGAQVAARLDPPAPQRQAGPAGEPRQGQAAQWPDWPDQRPSGQTGTGLPDEVLSLRFLPHSSRGCYVPQGSSRPCRPCGWNSLACRRTGGAEQRITLADMVARHSVLEMADNPKDGIEIRWGAR
jgi:hypothetical protein